MGTKIIDSFSLSPKYCEFLWENKEVGVKKKDAA